MEVIHEHTLDLGQSHGSLGWTVTRQPEGVTDPMVVSFRKVGTQRTLLNQNARWTPLGWDPKRWQPKAPQVPLWLIEKVVNHMLQLEVPS